MRCKAGKRAMGFWHTGYFEFHEPTEEGSGAPRQPRPPSFPCPICGVEFSSEADLRIHTFEGHPTERPVLVLNGRECGQGRLTITYETAASDWVIRNAGAVWINGHPMSVWEAVDFVSAQRHGVVDVTLGNGNVQLDFHFEFALADADDLEGVDAALQHLVGGAELSPRTIDDFIMRSKRYPTGWRYYSGLADYLYGVFAREKDAESVAGADRAGARYEERYNGAVEILGTFDRPPAEAICGIVAFHYNQFERAMTKTRSQRVAEVSMRFQAMLRGENWQRGNLALSPHTSLDFALSDSVIEQVLEWSALPLDGTAAARDVTTMVANIGMQRPSDALKLHLIAAEHYLAAGSLPSAAQHAEQLRHGRTTEGWYSDFQHRLQGDSQ
jgi:hypothetical protein